MMAVDLVDRAYDLGYRLGDPAKPAVKQLMRDGWWEPADFRDLRRDLGDEVALAVSVEMDRHGLELFRCTVSSAVEEEAVRRIVKAPA